MTYNYSDNEIHAARIYLGGALRLLQKHVRFGDRARRTPPLRDLIGDEKADAFVRAIEAHYETRLDKIHFFPSFAPIERYRQTALESQSVTTLSATLAEFGSTVSRCLTEVYPDYTHVSHWQQAVWFDAVTLIHTSPDGRSAPVR